MPIIRCPGCDEKMEIEAEWYGRTVACPNCDHRFKPSPSERSDDEPRPPRRRSREYDDDEPHPTRRSKQTRAPSRGALPLILFAAIGGPILLACLGCGGWLFVTITTPVSYSDPWVTQSLPDGSVSMQFPRKPTPETLGDAGITVGNKYLYIEPLPKDAAFTFGAVDFPTDRPGLFDEIYRSEIDDLKRSSGCRVGRESTIMVDGRLCKEAELTLGSGAIGRYRMIKLDRQSSGPRLVIVFVGGRNVSAQDQQKFLDSIRFSKK